MASIDDSSLLGGISSAPGAPAGYPFRGPGLWARVAPFGIVAVLAQASLALPSGSRMSAPAVVASTVLLLALPAVFVLPWTRLPSWMSVLFPLTFTGWVLALVLSESGSHVGLAPIALVPALWTALFHQRWESGCVVAAIAAVEAIDSVVGSASVDVTLRRVLLWVLLSGLISVAVQDLRERIRRSQRDRARLQERLRELSILQDRDRIAADLQEKVVQPIFAAGLTLQGAAAMVAEPELSRRLTNSVDDLDEVLRALRETIFGPQLRIGDGLRTQFLDMSGGLSPLPEVTFTGPVEAALPPAVSAQLLEILREALGLIRKRFIPLRIGVTAGEDSYVTVIEAQPRSRAGRLNGSAHEFTPLRERAAQAGIEMGIEPGLDGTRFAWHVPLSPG